MHPDVAVTRSCSSPEPEQRNVGLRIKWRCGPARIAYRLGLHPSTVHKVLTRYRCPPLAWTDRGADPCSHSRGVDADERRQLVEPTLAREGPLDAPDDLKERHGSRCGRVSSMSVPVARADLATFR